MSFNTLPASWQRLTALWPRISMALTRDLVAARSSPPLLLQGIAEPGSGKTFAYLLPGLVKLQVGWASRLAGFDSAGWRVGFVEGQGTAAGAEGSPCAEALLARGHI